MKNIIEVRELSFAFNGRQVLNSVSLDVTAGELTVLLGRNGSGKSTLLRLMAGILPYREGSVKVDGQQASRLTFRHRAKIMAFLPQKHKAVFPFTVEEVVLTGRAAHVAYVPSKKDMTVVHEAIRTAGIEHLKRRYYTELSGGEQQLVMIARTLAQQPRIILLDEPVSHLDYNNQLRILGLLKKLAGEGMTLVAVIHDPNLAFLFGDRFIYVHEKRAHTVKGGKAWEHELMSEVFHEDLHALEHEGRNLFVPKLS